ncbi:MAG TPA: hypothetical protein VGB05_11770, partial [Pyrinomonadaceae bacterium]
DLLCGLRTCFDESARLFTSPHPRSHRKRVHFENNGWLAAMSMKIVVRGQFPVAGCSRAVVYWYHSPAGGLKMFNLRPVE